MFLFYSVLVLVLVLVLILPLLPLILFPLGRRVSSPPHTHRKISAPALNSLAHPSILSLTRPSVLLYTEALLLFSRCPCSSRLCSCSRSWVRPTSLPVRSAPAFTFAFLYNGRFLLPHRQSLLLCPSTTYSPTTTTTTYQAALSRHPAPAADTAARISTVKKGASPSKGPVPDHGRKRHRSCRRGIVGI